MISVLIVEDDPMVAEFNKRYLEEIEGFTLKGIAKSVDEAITKLEELVVDLILLDVFMPGKNGLELLSFIREKQKGVDVILITAASDIDHIQHSLRLGAVDYLIKPFHFERFHESLTAYREKSQFMKKQNLLDQNLLDKKILQKDQRVKKKDLPKGLTKETLKTIWNVIENQQNEEAFTTEYIAVETGISRVSVRKYLLFLDDLGILEMQPTYGSIGRPINFYKCNHHKDDIIHQYV